MGAIGKFERIRARGIEERGFKEVKIGRRGVLSVKNHYF